MSLISSVSPVVSKFNHASMSGDTRSISLHRDDPK
jgi:hypothetical protein